MSGGTLGDRLRYSAGALQFNLFDGLDGDDATRSTGGQGMVQYDFSATTNLMLRVLGSDDRVELNSSPTAGGIPAANVPQATIVDAIPVSPDQIERSNRGLPVQIGNATYIPGRNDPDSLRTSSFLATALRFRHSGWSGIELAGELSARSYAAHVYEWCARRRLPADGGELLRHFRRYPYC